MGIDYTYEAEVVSVWDGDTVHLLVVGSLVVIHTPKDARDDYGRPLVSIRRSDGVNVNQAMLDAGQAVPLGPYAP